jgi:hypothetical protein
MEEDLLASVLFLWLSSLADFFWRSRFPSCDSCTIASVLCLTELWKNGMRRTLCNRCRQWKMACHWDLMGVTGPQDPNMSKRARRPVKKPVIDVDDLEDIGNSSLPSPLADIASLFFVLWNTANVRGHLSIFLPYLLYSLQSTPTPVPIPKVNNLYLQ